MNWLSNFVNWLKSTTGLDVYVDYLPDGKNSGIVYIAYLNGSTSHSEQKPGKYGKAEINIYVYDKKLSVASNIAEQIMSSISDIACSDGYLRGGVVTNYSNIYKPISKLHGVVIKLTYMYQQT